MFGSLRFFLALMVAVSHFTEPIAGIQVGQMAVIGFLSGIRIPHGKTGITALRERVGSIFRRPSHEDLADLPCRAFRSLTVGKNQCG